MSLVGVARGPRLTKSRGPAERIRVVLGAARSIGIPIPLPKRRFWAAALATGSFFAVFATIWTTTFLDVVRRDFSSVDGLFSAAFSGFWLLGWSVGTVFLGALTFLLLFYREAASIANGRVVIFNSLGFVRFCSEYLLSAMENLRTEVDGDSKTKLVRICFDYRQGRVGLGESMEPEAAERIMEMIRRVAATAANDAASPQVGWVIWEFALPQSAWGASSSAGAGGMAGHENRKSVGSRTAPSPLPLPPSSPSSVAALVFVNLIPVGGVLFFGWSLSDIMVIYWAESAVIGFYNVLKMLVVSKWLAILMAPFFIGHYGGFMAAHFFFIYSFFIGEGNGAAERAGAMETLRDIFVPLWPAVLALFISHGISFATNFVGRREYLRKSPEAQMTDPYKRIFVMHLTLIFGGWIMMMFHAPVGALSLLIILKTWVDLRAHGNEHVDRGDRN